MIKKYDDNYIDLSKVAAVSNINEVGFAYWFTVYLPGKPMSFSDTNKQRLSTLRERLIKDWMEVRSGK